jgi:hypothetical protein
LGINLKSKWELFKEKNNEDSAKIWDLVNPKIKNVDLFVQEKRMDICRQCDRFIKTTTQCKECGCIMKLKTKLPHASCPLGKWKQEDAIDL